MKIRTFTLFLTSFFFAFATSAMAGSNSTAAVTCPPVSVIKANGIFTYSQRTMLPTLKQIFTNKYVYEGQEWTTMFIFGKNLQQSETTLQYGQQLFNSLTLSDSPKLEQSQNEVMCTYPADKGLHVTAYFYVNK